MCHRAFADDLYKGNTMLTAQKMVVDGQLHRAAALGKVDLIRLYVKYGDDINARDEDGQTPLHLAYKYEQPAAVVALIDLYADQTIRNNDQKLPAQLIPNRDL